MMHSVIALEGGENESLYDYLCETLLPDVRLQGSDGAFYTLKEYPRVVIYVFPRITHANFSQPDGWENLAGMKGCSCQSKGFNRLINDFNALKVSVFGISLSSVEYYQEPVRRLGLTFPLLSDEDKEFIDALQIKTLTFDEIEVAERLTLYAEYGVIKKVYYPIKDPKSNAQDVLKFCRDRQ